ncbi:MAG: metallophosphoesterase [Lachnospiraceae bacterium]|nr:metallophosphoesterase [Lachnospiraceae bacterium]
MIWAVVIFFLALIMVGVVAFDSNRFVVRSVSVETDKVSEDLRFLFISDLHSRIFGKRNKRLYDALDKIEFDGALLAGDMMTADRHIDFAESIGFLQYLKERGPVFYSLGNHESRSRVYLKTYGDLYERYCKALADIGVPMMDNESAEFRGVRITGLTLPEKYYNKRKKPVLPAAEIEELVGALNPEDYNILLAHNPEYFESYAEYGSDLVLSGHLHGGIVRIFGRGLISPRLELFPKFHGGEYKKGTVTMLVNRGLGGHHIPWRMFNPGEIIVLEIKSNISPLKNDRH